MPRKPLPAPNVADLAVHAVPVPGAMLVDVVVLTADQELFQSAREAVGERNPVWRARAADEAADLLINGRCGVLLIDMASVSTGADTLVEQIVEQFPDVVVCIAGTRADEPLLAPLISDGHVYRFMHKPTSARRAGCSCRRRSAGTSSAAQGAKPATRCCRCCAACAARRLACPADTLH